MKDLKWLWDIHGKRQLIYQRPNEAELLCKAIRMTEGPILEIGRARGGSTVLINHICEGKRDIHSIDLKNHLHAKCKKILDDCPNVHLNIGNSRESLSVDSYGFALIDGDHSYEGVVRDTEAHWNQVKEYLLYHDYNLKGVRRHINELVSMGYAEVVEVAGKSALIKKLSNLTDNKFCIKGEYVENLCPQYCKRKEGSIKNQFWIYERAFEFTKNQKFEKIGDLGCGYAGKLMHFFKNYDTVGFDYGENIKFCKSKYPDRAWEEIDLSNSRPKNNFDNSLIMCVDVIEHIVDPTLLLNYLSELSQNNRIMLSTPNRALRKGTEKNGPPKHKDHVREWTKDELQALLNRFNIGLIVYEEGRYLIAS